MDYQTSIMPASPTPDEVAEIRQLARINNFMPDIQALADKRIESITNRVMLDIRQGVLTPESAYSAWHEVAAYRNMLKSLNVKSKLAPQLAVKEI